MIKKILKIDKLDKAKKPGTNLDLKRELIEEFIERARVKKTLSYEEVIEFGDKNQLTEKETNDLLRVLEKKNINLVMQEELDDDLKGESFDTEDLDASKLQNIKASLSDIDEDADEDQKEDDEEDDDERALSHNAQITDPVKCYLRDIGRIPLLNKKTEGVISDKISGAKTTSIEALSHFPIIHKEFVLIADRLRKNTMQLKDIVQFQEFDEENVPKIDAEQKALL